MQFSLAPVVAAFFRSLGEQAKKFSQVRQPFGPGVEDHHKKIEDARHRAAKRKAAGRYVFGKEPRATWAGEPMSSGLPGVTMREQWLAKKRRQGRDMSRYA